MKWVWHKRHNKAFREAKKLVSAAPVLAHYDADKPVKQYCDASLRGVPLYYYYHYFADLKRKTEGGNLAISNPDGD